MPSRLDYDWDHRIPHKTIGGTSHYPIITNVQISASGLVTWTTDIASTSQVHYGTTPNLGPFTTFDGTLVTSHSVQLSGLSDGVRYYLKVQSFYLDSLSISDLYSFIFSVATGDILMEDGLAYILMEDGTKILVES